MFPKNVIKVIITIVSVFGVKVSRFRGSKVQGFVKLVLFVSLVELVGLNRTN